MALLATEVPRSEHDPDLEGEHDPGLELAVIAMHPVTGAFVDPTHESAVAAQLFRLAFPCHTFLLALNISVFTWMVSRSDSAAFWSIVDLSAVLALLGRMLLHWSSDPVRAQRIGAGFWTAMIVASWISWMSMFMLGTTVSCALAQLNYLGPLIALLTALVNGSHGMGFAHKGGVIGLLLVLDLLLVTSCAGFAFVHVLADAGAYGVGFFVAHMVELLLRQTYAEKVQDKQRLAEEKRRQEERLEQLRAEKERLMYDVQRRGQPLDDDDARSAIRRGLQARLGPSYHRAGSTDSRETGTSALSDSPLPSLPPGPPSSSAGKSSESGKSGEGMGGSDREGMVDRAALSRAPPQARFPTWEALDAQLYAERAQKTATEPRTASLATAEADRHGPPPSSTVCRTSAAATPAAPLPPRPASRQAEIDELLDRKCAEMAAASTAEQAGARRARGTKREAAGGEVAQVKAGVGKASAARAAAGRARAAKKPTTEQEDIEQLQSWQRSTDPIYVDARARLAAAESRMGR